MKDSLIKKQVVDMPVMTPEYLAFNNSREILSIMGTFTGLALTVVLLRIYVRAMVLRVFGPDDYIILVSMLLSIAVLICTIGQTGHGLGKHLLTWTPADFEGFQKWMFAQALIIVTGVSSVKISVGLSLARLWKGTRYTKLVWAVITFTIIFCLACNGTLIFQCIPVAASWDFSLRPPPFGTGDAKCYSLNTFRNIGLFNSVTNILTDILFATMPVPLIWQLQLNSRTKLSLIAILSLGYFATAAAIVKAVKQWNFFTEIDWSVHNSFNVWNDIEFNVGIIAACLPSLKPLFNWFLETARALTTGSGHRSRDRYGYGSHGYLKHKESSVAMDDLPSRSNYSADSKLTANHTSDVSQNKSPYNVRVSVGGKDSEHGGGYHYHSHHDDRDRKGSVGWGHDGTAAKRSDDSILPLQRPEKGIVRTTEVTIS